jgi:hypothetical protein
MQFGSPKVGVIVRGQDQTFVDLVSGSLNSIGIAATSLKEDPRLPGINVEGPEANIFVGVKPIPMLRQ